MVLWLCFRKNSPYLLEMLSEMFTDEMRHWLTSTSKTNEAEVELRFRKIGHGSVTSKGPFYYFLSFFVHT